jgi:hypothetical protein
MGKRTWVWRIVGTALLAASPAAPAIELTRIELTWLEATVPVLTFARAQGLPLDIIVQPQDAPGETPLGMAYVDGRCKLVLSMRGNAEAQATLDRIEPELRGPVIEAIAAHELGHCWRHLQNSWGSLPSGFTDAKFSGRVNAEQAGLLADMWRTRREEAYADLVGLAWTLQHHADRYEEVHAWHVRLRAEQAVDTGPHDTRAWVRLAADRTRFTPAASIFEQVAPLWTAGLLGGP